MAPTTGHHHAVDDAAQGHLAHRIRPERIWFDADHGTQIDQMGPHVAIRTDLDSYSSQASRAPTAGLSALLG